MQFDDEGNERIRSYQLRHMKSAEKNYLVPNKELLAMYYALTKFRTLAEYTDYAPLHLFQRMARCLSFFSNFVVHFKPGKNNALADALSWRADYDPGTVLRRQAIDDDDGDDHSIPCLASVVNLTKIPPSMHICD
ncbi:LOW QUALITY PROTEIN: Retrovirus Polyprotein [Phytophthora palmivora]|uniref:Retrovirus Polyprotein n=1 Tax=Phytophthora palmivora TaxID=4796 RepID=A0A2P4XF13_9STRA|nr:LOW QUALITY PROTEIN: Retrovirus Polyprotein [Phytophthora palmivora]